jgi:hypothetical protein
MKININKNGEKKSYKIISSWEDVTLEKWATLVAASKGAKGKKAAEAIANITNLSDIPDKLLKQLSLKDVANLMEKLADIQSRANTQLVNKIKVDGKEYGFHPNLEEITLGEYADIENCISEGIENTLNRIMAVLYRPITSTQGRYYTIEAYDVTTKKEREQIFKAMPAATVESALLFFWTFVSELLKILPLYTTEKLKAATS